MRSKFPGYFRPEKAEFDDIWKRGLVVPDTNILLHLLRFKRETRDEIFKTLKALKARLWLPHRVAFEFSRKWMEIEEENRTSYIKLKEKIVIGGNSLSGLFDSIARYQIVDAATEKKKVAKFIEELCASVDQASKDHPNFEEAEKIVDNLAALFEQAIGDAPAGDFQSQWKKDAGQRYADKVPPGYADDKKEGDDKFGDYIIWREMIEIAKAKKLPVIFLSDDRKDDWALIRGGQDKGPRPELMQEFWEETGQRFYSYPLTVFLERAKEYTNVVVSKKVIEDVETQTLRRQEVLRQEEAQLARRSAEINAAFEAARSVTALKDSELNALIRNSQSLSLSERNALLGVTRGYTDVDINALLGNKLSPITSGQNALRGITHNYTLAEMNALLGNSRPLTASDRNALMGITHNYTLAEINALLGAGRTLTPAEQNALLSTAPNTQADVDALRTTKSGITSGHDGRGKTDPKKES